MTKTKRNKIVVKMDEADVSIDRERLISFIHRYDFLFKHINTRFFTDRLWKEIPAEWMKYLSNLSYADLNRIPIEAASFEDAPCSMKEFFIEAQRLTVLRDPLIEENTERETRIRGIKAKKEHELHRLGGMIHEECTELGVNRIVDIGCGLGHLLKYLGSFGDYELVGLEADSSLCSSGKDFYDKVQFENVKLSEDTDPDEIRRIFSKEGKRTALVSLHGCGNLQPLLLRLFSNFDREMNPLLLTLGCCYHKMTDGLWPLSDAFKNATKEMPSLPHSAFRLACQERMTKWIQLSDKDHKDHKQAFLNRAILEGLYDKMGVSNIDARRMNRKLGKSLEEVLENLIKRNEVPEEDRENWRRVFQEIVDENQSRFGYIEPFTALQYSMQGVLESFILLDRQEFLHENGLHCELRPVFNSLISPRNMCLISRSAPSE